MSGSGSEGSHVTIKGSFCMTQREGMDENGCTGDHLQRYHHLFSTPPTHLDRPCLPEADLEDFVFLHTVEEWHGPVSWNRYGTILPCGDSGVKDQGPPVQDSAIMYVGRHPDGTWHIRLGTEEDPYFDIDNLPGDSDPLCDGPDMSNATTCKEQNGLYWHFDFTHLRICSRDGDCNGSGSGSGS